MSMRIRITVLGLGLALALTAGATPARAGFNANVLSGATAEGGGLYLYTYMVQDLATSTLAVSEFDMVIPTDANLQSLMAPSGFLALYTPGDVTISFVSNDAATDIQPGLSGTFSFTSMDAPGLGSFSLITYDDPNGFGSGDMISGVSVAPQAVPEPGSLVLLGLGLPGMIALVALRRRRHSVESSGALA
jgi:hypothetical protein